MRGVTHAASRVGPSVSEFLESRERSGRVASTFSGGVVVSLETGAATTLIAVQSALTHFHPWAVEIETQARVPVGARVRAGSSALRFEGGPQIRLKSAEVPELRALALSADARRQAAEELGALKPKLPQPDLLAPIEAWRRGGDPARLLALIGSGPGSSPLGDDLLVGLLAGIATAGTKRPRHLEVGQEIAASSLVDRTPLGSVQMLAAASEGRFPEPLCLLIEALAKRVAEGSQQRDLLACRVANLLQMGDSSGTGFLHGLRAGLSASASSL